MGFMNSLELKLIANTKHISLAKYSKTVWDRSVDIEIRQMLAPTHSTLNPKADWNLPKAKKTRGIVAETLRYL